MKLTNKVCLILLFIVLLISCIPLFCGYIMEGGIIEETILGKSVLYHHLFILAVQAEMSVAVWYMFQSLWENAYVNFFGTSLCMLAPYRACLLYDVADMEAVLFWCFVPWIITGIGLLIKREWGKGSICFVAGIIPSTLVIYYLEPTSLKAGDSLQGYYSIKDIFSSFHYAEGKPGLGLGLILSFILFLWIIIVKGERKLLKTGGVCMVGGLFFLFLSSIMDFPVSVGMASLLLSMPGALAVGEFMCMEERETVKNMVFVSLLAAGAGVYIYICNSLTYTRLPLVY